MALAGGPLLSTAAAQTQGEPLALDWGKLRSAKSVLVTGVGSEPPRELGEAGVLRAACIYRTEEPEQIREFVDILQEFEFSMDHRPPVIYEGRNRDEQHMSIGARYIFSLADGAEVKFIEYGSKWFLIAPPQFNGLKLKYSYAKDELYRKLIRWQFRLPSATVLDPTIVSSVQCERRRKKKIYEIGM